MSAKATVISEIYTLAARHDWTVPELTEDLVLLDSGLDSLAIAILVVRLEEVFGFDPFSESTELAYPVTLGDFIRFYEQRADGRVLDTSRSA
jgi:acyl carrier protein